MGKNKIEKIDIELSIESYAKLRKVVRESGLRFPEDVGLYLDRFANLSDKG